MHVPKKLPDEGRQLLVWCHPGSGQPKPQFDWWRSSKLFRQDTILLCPQAQGRGWNIRHDAPYVDQLIKKVVTDYQIDPSRIILGGHSSGGFFSYQYGLKRQGSFAALLIAGAFYPGTPPKVHAQRAPPHCPVPLPQ